MGTNVDEVALSPSTVTVPRRQKPCVSRASVKVGGTGLEPVTPNLSTWCRSRPFAQVRSNSMVEWNPPGDRTLERTRTNASPCHSCHARQTLHVACAIAIRHGACHRRQHLHLPSVIFHPSVDTATHPLGRKHGGALGRRLPRTGDLVRGFGGVRSADLGLALCSTHDSEEIRCPP
jgi:hypothetical protein